MVIYGGEKVFAAGADVKEMAGRNYAEMAAISRRLHASFRAVAAIGKPVVAAITGFALGGGLELALCADFRVAGENARFGVPEILLGVIPGLGGTQRLPRLIGPARAKNLIYTGRFVDAEEALRIGLVDQVVPDADVYRRRDQARRAVRVRSRAGTARGQGGDRHRAGPRPRRRARGRAPALRGAIRHRGSEARHGEFRGQRARQGEVRRASRSRSATVARHAFPAACGATCRTRRNLVRTSGRAGRRRSSA